MAENDLARTIELVIKAVHNLHLINEHLSDILFDGPFWDENGNPLDSELADSLHALTESLIDPLHLADEARREARKLS